MVVVVVVVVVVLVVVVVVDDGGDDDDDDDDGDYYYCGVGDDDGGYGYDKHRFGSIQNCNWGVGVTIDIVLIDVLGKFSQTLWRGAFFGILLPCSSSAAPSVAPC